MTPGDDVRPGTHFVWDARQGLEVQDRQNQLPGVQDAKRRSVALLDGASTVADVGCGTGLDLHELGRRAVGLDSSFDMLTLVRKRGGRAVLADVEALPLRDGTCDGVRIDRVLYHLKRPETAIAEAARVLRRGGCLVCTHPDYESMLLEVPGAPRRLVELTKTVRVQFNYRDATVARRIPRLMNDAGLVDVTTEAFTLVTDDPDEPSLSVPTWLASSRQRGQIDVADAELELWDRAIEECRHRGGYLVTVTYLLTHARKS